MPKEKCSVYVSRIYVKNIGYCLWCSSLEAKKEVSMQVTCMYDVNVITPVRKANVRLVHNYCKTDV